MSDRLTPLKLADTAAGNKHERFSSPSGHIL